MADELIAVSPDWAKRAYVDEAKYKAMYEASIKDPDDVLGRARQAHRLDQALHPGEADVDFTGDVRIRWFDDGVLNVSANCLDRHLAKRGDQTAIIWEGDDPAKSTQDHLPRAARRGLPLRQRAEGARRQEGRPRHHLPADDPRGRRRHAGLRAHRRDPLGRLRRLLARQPGRPHPATATASVVITADEGLRGGKHGAAEGQRRRGAAEVPRASRTCIVVRHTGGKVADDGRPRPLVARDRRQACRPTARPSRWTPRIRCSSSTPPARPASPRACCTPPAATWSTPSLTHEYVFDYHDGDIYWCTADIGWVTGHSYIVYGPLANGATTLMFEGVPNYPDARPLLGGRSTSTRSTSSTPRRPPSAR